MADEANEKDGKEASGTGISRRMFLKGVAAGAVAAGVIAAAPNIAAATQGIPEGNEAEIASGGSSGPIVMYVRDPTTGEVGILSGTKEVVRRDPALVSRLKASGTR